MVASASPLVSESRRAGRHQRRQQEGKLGGRPRGDQVEGRGAPSLAGIRAFGRKGASTRAMDWWEKVVFPVKRAWVAVAARVKTSRKSGPGILKLQDDVQTCEYQDVQVMWEILRTEMEVTSHPAKRKRPLSGAFGWSNQAPSTGIEHQHHHHHHHHHHR